MDMNIEKCKDCINTKIFREATKDGEYITLYCPCANECPYKNDK